ncbi:hypothetical protein BC936DRAFT_137968 [Jimgerdemannia flammicorona]|nr:hypothetical protein BC936DRAFT_137968 [Jimgerdemannia flammicorona]
MTLGIGLISTFDISTSEANIYGFTIIAGLGTGFHFSATIIAVQSATEIRDIATVTGLVNFFRILGGAVGIAVAAATLENSLITSLSTILPPDLVPVVINSVSFIREGLPKQFVAPVINAYVDGLRLVYLILIPMGGISFLISLFVQHHSLRRPASRVQNSKELEHKSEEHKPEHEPEERVVVITED